MVIKCFRNFVRRHNSQREESGLVFIDYLIVCIAKGIHQVGFTSLGNQNVFMKTHTKFSLQLFSTIKKLLKRIN